MAVSIRLKMLGTKHRPCYRIVALDNRKTRDGKTLENLGQYSPLTEPAGLEIEEDVVLDLLNKGAVPSETVRGLLKQKGIVKVQQKNASGKPRFVWAKRD
jgi:small subunit ribosomal protein S16